MTNPVWSHVLASSALPNCIRYIIGVFCYNFKSHTNIINTFHINTLACAKAEILYSPCSGIHTSHTLCRITQA